MQEDTTGVWRPEVVRHCPRCTYPLVAIGYQGAEVDHCHRCGGTAVEPGNMDDHFGEWADPKHWLESMGQATTGEVLRCPVDGGAMTGFQVPFGMRSVVVDHCGTCGCVWFDAGEGQKLASIVQEAATAGPEANRRGLWTADYEVELEQDRLGKPGAGTYVFQLLTGMPVEVWNPVHGKTPVMKTLFWFIVLIFGVELLFFLSAGEQAAQEFINTFGMVPDTVKRGGNLWSLVTHMFLHGGLIHLFGNAYFLWVFGDNVEDRVGVNKFVLLYFVAGLFGALLHLLFAADGSIPMVGASGAVAGLMGAYLMLFPKVKLWIVFFFMHWRIPVLVYFGFWIALQGLAIAIEAGGVAWWAHIGGFVAGLLLGWVYRDTPHPLEAQERRVVGR